VSGAALAEPPAAPPSVRVTLADGSDLRGQPRFTHLPVRTAYAEIKIDLTTLESAEFDPAAGTVRLLLRNGDRLHATPLVTELGLQAIFGEVKLPLRHVTRLITERGDAAAGLILYYSFDQDGDGEVRNEVADRHHGTLRVARWVATGKHGGAVRVPGNGAHVLIAHHPDLDFGREDFSYALWFQADELGGSQQLFWHSYNPEIQIEPDGRVLAYFAFRFCGTFASTTRVEAGQWHHVAVTRAKGTGTLYLDGRKEASVDAAGCVSSSPDPVLLGTDSGGGEPFTGLIDEFAVWRRALTESEVKALYDRGRPVR